MAIFGLAFEKRTFDSSGYSVKGTLIYTSPISRRGSHLRFPLPLDPSHHMGITGREYRHGCPTRNHHLTGLATFKVREKPDSFFFMPSYQETRLLALEVKATLKNKLTILFAYFPPCQYSSLSPFTTRWPTSGIPAVGMNNFEL